jgi:hypothetical protein
VTRRIRIRTLVLVAVALVAMMAVPSGAATGDDGVGFGSLTPSSGAPGTEISYTVVGSPIADSECRGSSAFTTEFLAADGVRLGTGADTIGVPETATAGPAFVRLVCYVSDATGRRVIRGVCASFEVLAPGGAAGATGTTATGSTVNVPCPASPRTVISQSVIRSHTSLGEAFNLIIPPLGG